MNTSAPSQTSPAGTSKTDPEVLSLRAAPRPVTRLNRRMLAALAGLLGACVLGGTLWSLQSRHRERDPGAELYNVDHVAQAENLEAA